MVTPFTLRGKVNGDKASPPTLCFPRWVSLNEQRPLVLQGEGSDMFSNCVLFRLHFHGILLPSLFGEGLGVRLSFLFIPLQRGCGWGFVFLFPLLGGVRGGFRLVGCEASFPPYLLPIRLICTIFANRITSVLCWCRNMRQKLLRSFPNRYLFSFYS